MSTFRKFDGQGFTLYEIADPHGRRGSIRIDCDGGLQFTPHSEMGCSTGTMWLTPEDEAYSEVLAELQKVAAMVPATPAQQPLQLGTVAV
jgi:hypothetical protein